MKGTTKKLIAEIMSFTEEVDLQGKPVKRTHVPRDLLRGYNEVLESLQKCAQVGLIKTGPDAKPQAELTMEDISWMTIRESQAVAKEDPTKRIIAERYIDGPLSLSTGGLAAFAYFFNGRKELPICQLEVIDEIEELLKTLSK